LFVFNTIFYGYNTYVDDMLPAKLVNFIKLKAMFQIWNFH